MADNARVSAENGHTTSDVQTHIETQFLRDGEWLPYVLIRRDEIGAVKCRHRTVVTTTTTHASDWQRGRKAETIPGPQSLPVHLGRKGDPIFTECDIDRANARRWSWDRDDVTCEKCLAVVVPPAKHDCAKCEDCLHDGHKCCGCYDGACCKEVRQ